MCMHTIEIDMMYRSIFETLLPRGSNTKNTDAALLSTFSFPGSNQVLKTCGCGPYCRCGDGPTGGLKEGRSNGRGFYIEI